MSALTILVALGALYAAFGTLIAKVGLRGLTCTRSFSCPAAHEGTTGEMIEVVRNARPMRIPWLRVESRISPHLRLGEQDNLLVSFDTHACSLFTLMPYQQIKRRHKVRFLRRGEYNLGNATLTVGDPLGVYQTSREQDMDAPLLVYPRMLSDEEIPTPLLTMLGDISAMRSLSTDPFLVRGIRPYRMGDPVRDIHWAATARTGEAQVRLHDYTARSQLMVVFNAERVDQQWSDRLMDYEEEDIEHVIAVAATVCIRALALGLCVGFAANMPLGKAEASTVLPPVSRANGEEALLTAFARLQIRRTDSFYGLLSSLTNYTDLDMIVISRYTNERIEGALYDLRRSGNRVHLHLTGGEPA